MCRPIRLWAILKVCSQCCISICRHGQKINWTFIRITQIIRVCRRAIAKDRVSEVPPFFMSNVNSISENFFAFTFINNEYLPFGFADPPENTTVSNSTIDVIEGQPPSRVTCVGTAYPPLQYHWYREGNPAPIADTAGLQLYTGMSRADGGDYTCVSSNKHGNQSAVMKMNILCTY